MEENKNMNDDLLSNENLPIEIPDANYAWEDMRSRLENDSRKTAVSSISSTTTNNSALRVLSLLLLTSILCMLWIKMEKTSISTSKNKLARNFQDKTETGEKNNLQKNNNGLHVSDSTLIKENKAEHFVKNDEEEKSSISIAKNSLTTDKIRNHASMRNAHKRNKESKPKQTTEENYSNISSIGFNETKIFDDNASTDSTFPKEKNAIALKPVAKHSLQAKKQTDSTSERTTEEEDHFLLIGGLQWSAQIPFKNAGNYFMGTNGQPQPYRILLPGAWIHLSIEKSLFDIEFNPFVTNVVPSKTFSVSTATHTNTDSVTNTTQSKSLSKLFGFTASIGYEYSPFAHWWAGGGLQAAWWQKGIASNNIYLQSYTISNPTLKTNKSSSSMYLLSDSDWSNFSKFQLGIFAEVQYRKNLWQTGFRFILPFAPLLKTDASYNPVRAELFFRLKLFEKQIKSD